MTIYRLIPSLLKLGACDEAIVYLAHRKCATFAEAFRDVYRNWTSWTYWLVNILEEERFFTTEEWHYLQACHPVAYDETHLRVIEEAVLRVPLRVSIDVPFEVVVTARAGSLPRILDNTVMLHRGMRNRLEAAVARKDGRFPVASLLRHVEQWDDALGAALRVLLQDQLDLRAIANLGVGTPEWYAQVSYVLYGLCDHDMLPMYQVRATELLKRVDAVKALKAEAH